MADIIIKAPFDIVFGGDVHIDALSTDSKAKALATAASIDTFEYKRGGSTWTLPTSGSASSRHGTDSADLDNLDGSDTGSPPPTPFALDFNTGTLSLDPSSGSPYKVKIADVDFDLKVTGAATAATYDSGGTVVLHGGGTDSPTRRTP
jgi:hypothetical protein